MSTRRLAVLGLLGILFLTICATLMVYLQLNYGDGEVRFGDYMLAQDGDNLFLIKVESLLLPVGATVTSPDGNVQFENVDGMVKMQCTTAAQNQDVSDFCNTGTDAYALGVPEDPTEPVHILLFKVIIP